MLILIKNYRITSSRFGYTLARKKGSQWSAIGYYGSLDKAINDLLNYRVNTETSDFVIDFNNQTEIESQKEDFLKKINDIKNEVLGGLRNGKK